MSRYCLDTSAYSQFKRGEPEVTELIDRAEWIGVSSIVARVGTPLLTFDEHFDAVGRIGTILLRTPPA